ncbi:single-stranded DNA-binding protein [Leucobacter massiliensis]|uniref:Single-stranded DNA-binding protein n=1 Tax=Leucobacter massiliensis TaxID=1686285 RepID=A0A2S9QQB6_9MICO|nr:single-stranded DNA-binding protein [Leucobacter massiliensis]PRI11775.1 hypothetical protein B4915_04880 [Leucobacter massiliensis]
MSTPICIVGTVATEPRFSRGNAQVPFCSFRVASTERRFDREQGQWVDGETNWYTITSFRGLAEHALGSFAKGDRVVVSGRLRIRRWSSGEKSGTNVEIEADAFGHDLRWGVSSFTKRLGAETSPRGEVTPPPETSGSAEDPNGADPRAATGAELPAWLAAPAGDGPRGDDGFTPAETAQDPEPAEQLADAA